jgi:hypothetical protein
MNFTDIGWIIVGWTALAVLLYLGPQFLEDLKDHWRK